MKIFYSVIIFKDSYWSFVFFFACEKNLLMSVLLFPPPQWDNSVYPVYKSFILFCKFCLDFWHTEKVVFI